VPALLLPAALVPALLPPVPLPLEPLLLEPPLGMSAFSSCAAQPAAITPKSDKLEP
jgi:hypothetical protein